MQDTYKVMRDGITIVGYAIPQTLEQCLSIIAMQFDGQDPFNITVKQAIEAGYSIIHT